MPRLPFPGRVGGGGQDVDQVVVQHPVLLGDQVEVLDPGGDRVLPPLVGDGDRVGQKGVLFSAAPIARRDARMGGELAAHQVQVVRAGAEGVDDAAVPAGEPRSGGDRRGQTGHLVAGDLRHRHALHDEVGVGQCGGVGVDLRRPLHPYRVSVAFEERDEQVRRLDRPVSLPAASDHQGSAPRHTRSFPAASLSPGRRPAPSGHRQPYPPPLTALPRTVVAPCGGRGGVVGALEAAESRDEEPGRDGHAVALRAARGRRTSRVSRPGVTWSGVSRRAVRRSR